MGSVVSAAIWKANRALSIALMALSGLAVGVGAGLRKRKPWAIPGTHLLFAFVTLSALLRFLFLGLGANGDDPRGSVDAPATTFGWIVYSVQNAEGVASTVAPVVLSLLLAVWIPSYVSLQGQRVRSYFNLPASEVTGKSALACISLCFLLPLYGLAIPVALYDPDDLADAGLSFQLLSSIDAWIVLAMTIYGVRISAGLWSCQPGAVRRAEKLLGIRFIYGLCFGTLLFILAPNTTADTVAEWLLFGGGRYSFLTGMACGALYIVNRRWTFCLGAPTVETRIP